MRTHQVALGQTVCLVPDLLFTPECALALGLATMCLLGRPTKTTAIEDVVITQVKGEVRDHSIKQSRLVAFDRQDIIRLLIHDRFSDFHLTARIFVFQGGRRS